MKRILKLSLVYFVLASCGRSVSNTDQQNNSETNIDSSFNTRKDSKVILTIDFPGKSKYYNEEFSKLKPHNLPSGLLLGFNTSKGYRTLFIINEKGTTTVVLDLPFLATPQESGFYFIDEMFSDSTIVESYDTTNAGFCVSNSEVRVFKNAIQINKFSKDKTDDDSIGCYAGSEANTENVQYIIPNFISLNYTHSGYHTGAQHGYNSSGSRSMNFDWFYHHIRENLDDSLILFGLKDIYNKKKDSVDSVLHLQLDSVAIYKVDLDDISYFIERQNGEVHLYCHAATFVSYMQSHGDYAAHAYCDLGRLDNLFVKNNVFPLDYGLIADQKIVGPNDYYSNIVDILISPSQDVVYLIIYNSDNYKSALIGIDIKTKKEILNFPLNGSGIVMAEWVTGKQINKWKKALSN